MRHILLGSMALLTALVCAGCGSEARPPNAADRIFLQDMISHHARAIVVARIAETRATDPRVRAFAVRIVREQTPELDAMRNQAAAGHLPVNATLGARMARNRITDAEVAALRRLRGGAFDQRFLALNITSEQGAAAMARAELSAGADPAIRAIASPISTAPTTQIPELEALLAKIS